MPFRKILLLVDCVILGSLGLFLIYIMTVGAYKISLSSLVFSLILPNIYTFGSLILNIIIDSVYYKFQFSNFISIYRLFFVIFLLLIFFVGLSSGGEMVFAFIFLAPTPLAFILSFWQYLSIKPETEKH
jgi:hypothetical protein